MDKQINSNQILLDIVGSLGEVKGTIKGMNEKISVMCIENPKEHQAMWRIIDNHSKTLNRIIGGVIVVGSVFSFLWFWLKETVKRGI